MLCRYLSSLSDDAPKSPFGDRREMPLTGLCNQLVVNEHPTRSLNFRAPGLRRSPAATISGSLTTRLCSQQHESVHSDAEQPLLAPSAPDIGGGLAPLPTAATTVAPPWLPTNRPAGSVPVLVYSTITSRIDMSAGTPCRRCPRRPDKPDFVDIGQSPFHVRRTNVAASQTQGAFHRQILFAPTSRSHGAGAPRPPLIP